MICSIAIVNHKTSELHSFSLQNYIIQGKSLMDSEKELLSNFVNFFNSLKNPIFIHWNMTGLEYGFKAIRARCENYGFYNLSFANLTTFNLKDLTIYSLYGLLENNYCASLDILKGREELICFKKRNYNMVKLSTEAKAIGLNKIMKLVMKNKVNMFKMPDIESIENTCDE